MRKRRTEVPPEIRFERFVDRESSPRGCHLWQGRRDRQDYGHFNVWHGHTVLAHRWNYEHRRGPIPASKQLHHICETPACVNPDHLLAVTRLEHARFSREARQTHCKRGHAFDAANTRVRGRSRWCRACDRIRQAQAKERRKAATL